MKLFKKMSVVGAVLGCLFIGSNAFAQGGNTASDTGTATASVIGSLSMVNNEDMDFGEGIQGDAAKTVFPLIAGRAYFGVSGEALRFYNVTAPADGVVVMTTGGGGANETIAVDSWNFYSGGANSASHGQIGLGGSDQLFLGATRAALGAAQVPGAYSGDYTVTVVYQ